MSSLPNKNTWDAAPSALRCVDDIAWLRINPGLRYKHRVGKDTTDALSLFLGNASDGLPRPRKAHWVLPHALSNVVELSVDDIVVQNHLDRGQFRVFRVDARDLPSALSVHYTKVIPRDEHLCRDYLRIALRASLKRLAKTWLEQEAPTRALGLRTFRELTLYWPARAIQQGIVAEHGRLTANYTQAHTELDVFEQRLRDASVLSKD